MDSSSTTMETQTLSIPVVMPRAIYECRPCIERLQQSLLQIKGVSAAKIDPADSTIALTFDPNLVSMDKIERTAEKAGVRLAESFQHETYNLMGLHCIDCAETVEKSVAQIGGVVWVGANFAASKILVEYEGERVKPEQIVSRIRSLGYGAERQGAVSEPHEQQSFWRRNKETLVTGISGALLIAGWLIGRFVSGDIGHALYLLSMIVSGYPTLRVGLLALRAKTLNVNFLMGFAGIGAVALGEYLEGALVLFLYSLGETLESYTVDKTRNSIRSLMSLFPGQARVVRDGAEIDVPVEQVRVGDVMIVRPGERIAMDGKIIAGASTVDQSPITGESIPVAKGVADEIYAGSINQRGALEVKVTRDARDNTISRIIHLVEQAQAQKAPSQRITETFGAYYTPAVIILAVVVAAALPTLFAVPFREAFYKALTLLVIACPCALVLSTPIAIISAISNAARRGVLVKGGAYLEAMGRIDVVAFDKTGTLTRGRPRITDIVVMDASTPESLLAIAASLEARSEHPLAGAILREASEREIGYEAPKEFISLPGRGVQGVLEGVTYRLGSLRVMNGLVERQEKAKAMLEEMHRQGKTGVVICTDDKLLGIIAVADEVRPGAKAVIEGLRSSGVHRIVMLTGDHEFAARAISEELGIDEYHAGLLPEDKVAVMRDLMERHGRVAMVGDGINDAPALALATVGIAMGAAGTDQALESADIALMADDLSRLPFAVRLSRRTLSTVRANVGIAVGAVLLLVGGALIGKVTLTTGVIGHEGSALVVIANGMRLLTARTGR